MLSLWNVSEVQKYKGVKQRKKSYNRSVKRKTPETAFFYDYNRHKYYAVIILFLIHLSQQYEISEDSGG